MMSSLIGVVVYPAYELLTVIVGSVPQVFVVQLALQLAGHAPLLLPASQLSPASVMLLPHTVGVLEMLKLLLALVIIALPAVSLHRTYVVFVPPLTSPLSVLVWLVLPAPVMVFGMLAYAMSVLLQRQVLVSSVVTLSVVCVVPAARTCAAVGVVMLAVGGVVSASGVPGVETYSVDTHRYASIGAPGYSDAMMRGSGAASV
jgi:hypothetical protein